MVILLMSPNAGNALRFILLGEILNKRNRMFTHFWMWPRRLAGSRFFPAWFRVEGLVQFFSTLFQISRTLLSWAVAHVEFCGATGTGCMFLAMCYSLDLDQEVFLQILKGLCFSLSCDIIFIGSSKGKVKYLVMITNMGKWETQLQS